MNARIGPILLQVAKTGLIAGSLGMLLYAAFTFVADLSQAKWLISMLLSAPMAVLLGFGGAQALRTGIFPAMGGAVIRTRQPLSYWCLTITYMACGLLLGALAAWSAYRLASGS